MDYSARAMYLTTRLTTFQRKRQKINLESVATDERIPLHPLQCNSRDAHFVSMVEVVCAALS